MELLTSSNRGGPKQCLKSNPNVDRLWGKPVALVAASISALLATGCVSLNAPPSPFHLAEDEPLHIASVGDPYSAFISSATIRDSDTRRTLFEPSGLLGGPLVVDQAFSASDNGAWPLAPNDGVVAPPISFAIDFDPLAYAGLGLLILMNRMVDPERTEWGRWIVLLGLGGFVGNFILSLCDHAQNGFFVPSEWIPVFSSAFAVGFLVLAATRPVNRPFLGVCALVLLVQAVVGGLGFALHLRGVAGGIGPGLWANLLYGPPIFAPLLFVDLALLSGIGIFDLTRREP